MQGAVKMRCGSKPEWIQKTPAPAEQTPLLTDFVQDRTPGKWRRSQRKS
jgi:hypothetical protein